MAGVASAHQAATASREQSSQQRAVRTRRTSADPQQAQQGQTAAAAAAPTALDSLSRLQQLADASPRVAQLRRLQALADGRFAPVAQFAGGPVEEEHVQGKFSTAQLQPQLQQAPRANNTGLPDQLKSGIESLSGMSMDDVRVHYNSSQPAQLNALAYAQGSDIHLAPGQEQHLPHEAWHVVQQAQGRVRPTMQMKDGVQLNDDVGLEREADVMGAKAMQLKAVVKEEREVIRSGGVVHQRIAHMYADKKDAKNYLIEARDKAKEFKNGTEAGDYGFTGVRKYSAEVIVTEGSKVLLHNGVGPLKNNGKPEKGHALAKSSGGDGNDPDNIFAQDGGHNNGGQWKSFETTMRKGLDEASDNADVLFRVHLNGVGIKEKQKISDAYDSDASDMDTDYFA